MDKKSFYERVFGDNSVDPSKLERLKQVLERMELNESYTRSIEAIRHLYSDVVGSPDLMPKQVSNIMSIGSTRVRQLRDRAVKACRIRLSVPKARSCGFCQQNFRED